MKATDLNEIRAVAAEELAQQGGRILDYLTVGESTDLLTMIYVTNDRAAGFTVDYLGNLSVISSPTRIAINFLNHHSFYKHDGTICLYNDLDDDIHEINIVLDAALDRWEEQNA